MDVRSPRGYRRLGLLLLLAHMPFIWWGAPDSWHPDEIAPREAVRMARTGDLVPLEPGNPTLHAYVLTALVALPERGLRHLVDLPITPIEAVTGAARVLSALIAALLALGVACLVASRAGPRAGLVAAVVVTACSLVMSGSRSATVDLPAAALLTLALARVVRAAESPDRALRGFLVAGLLSGLATATKFTVLLPAVTGVLAGALLTSRSRSGAVGAAALGGILGFVAGMPLTAAHPYDTAATFVIGHHHVAMLFGEDAPRAGLAPLTALGLSFGPVLSVLLLFGLARRRPRGAEIVWLAAAAAVLVPLGFARFFAPRYLLPAVAPLVIVAIPHIAFPRGRTALVLIVAAIQAALAVVQYPTDPRRPAERWLRERTGPEEAVAVTRYGPSPRGVRVLDLPVPHPGRVAYPAMERRWTLVIPRRLGRALGGGATPQARRAIAGMLAPTPGDVPPSLESLRQRGVRRIVVSSFAADRFGHPAVARTYPAMARLLRRLRGEDGVVLEITFEPLLPRWLRPPVAFTGPRLEIYRLR